MLLACAGLALAQENPTPGQASPEGIIPGQYIVVLKEGVREPTAVARAHAQRHGGEVLYTYQYAIKGYAARIPAQQLDRVRADEQVAYVEPDKTAEIVAQTLPWGFNRVEADISSTKAGDGSGVTANAIKPAIANMSLGGPPSRALDAAVRKSADSGVFYSVAAGNAGKDACNSSPARAGAGTNNGIATTAATNSSDAETSWSNYGSCVDIWAPGASILSTRRGGGTTTMSGTSMAAPHVAGGGALYLSKNNVDAATVEAALTSRATTTTNTSKDGRTIALENVGTF
jgi:subtilisin family serine protease